MRNMGQCENIPLYGMITWVHVQGVLRKQKKMASCSSFRCGICHELYIEPRMLQCLHSFCVRCLTKCLEGQKQGPEKGVICPTCQKTTLLPAKGVHGLPKDLRKSYEAKVAHYRERISTLITENDAKIQCERCVEGNPATGFCCQCCTLLCELCCDDHRRSKATLNHKLLHAPKSQATGAPAEETDSSDGELGLVFQPEMVATEPQPCSVHSDEILKFYCKTCSCLVCRDCTVVEHSGHKYDRMERVADAEKEKLSSLLDEATQTREQIEAAMSSVAQVRKEFDEKKQSIDDSIVSAFQKLEQSLGDRKEALLAKSAELSKGKVDRLNSQTEELDGLKNDTVHVAVMLQAAIKTYSVIEMLSVTSALASRLKELLSQLSSLSLDPCETKPAPVFVSLDPTAVCSILTEFGVITSGCCPGESTASLQIPSAVVGRERRVVVTARDQDGRVYSHGGENVQANLTVNGSTKPLVVSDNDDGMYVVCFVPESCGECSLSVAIQGQPIRGSPFQLQVHRPRDYHTVQYYEKCFTLSGTAWVVGVSNKREVFVGVGGTHCISVFDTEGYHLRSIGTKGSGRRQFSSPSGIAIHDDVMYVSEFFNHRIQKLSTLGDYKSTFGKHGSGDGEFNGPRGLCFDCILKLLFVSDSGNNRVSVFHLDGTFAYHITGSSSDKSLVDNPWGLAFDHLGQLHVVCYGANCVKVFSREGRYLMQYGHGKMVGPAGIAIDAEGYSFVSEYSGHWYRVLVFDAEHRVIHTIENFANPSALALDGEARLYVADHSNSRVLKY